MTQLPLHSSLPSTPSVESPKKALRIAGLTLLLGLVLTAILGRSVWNHERLVLEQQFALAANERIDRVSERMQLYQSELESVRRFYETSNQVSRDEFANFVRPLLRDTLGYFWMPKVNAADRASFEQNAQVDGVLGYQIYERDALNQNISAPQRDYYFPIFYAASDYLKELPYGLDLSFSAAGQDLAKRVVGSRRVTASIPTQFSRVKPKDSAGVMLATAFYKNSTTNSPTEETRAALQGILLSAISYRVLMEEGMDRSTLAQLSMTLLDNSDKRPNPPMYKSEVAAVPGTDLVAEEHVNFAGRDYLIRAEPSAEFLKRNHGQPHFWVFLSGFLTSLLLAGYLMTLMSQRQRALQLVEERTAELRTNQLRLQESEARLHFAMDSAGHGVWDWNTESGQVFYSHAWKAMLGFGDDEIGSTIEQTLQRIHPEDWPARDQALQSYLRGESKMYQSEHRLRNKEGRWLWVLDRGQVAEYASSGEPRRMIGTQTDISSRKSAELALAEVNVRLRALLDAATQVAIVSTDLNGLVRSFNVGAERMFGYSEQEVLGKAVPEDIFVEDEIRSRASDLSAALGRKIRGFEAVAALVGEGHEEHEWTCIRRDGQRLTINLIVTGVRDAQGVMNGYLGVAIDITRRKEAELELRRLSVTDALTGIHNRRYFTEQLDLSIARSSRNAEPLSLVMFDIDHFKNINDRFGHEAGDIVLVTLCQRVSQRLRKGDVFCRLGGEEMMVLCPGTTAEQAAILANALLQAMRDQPIEGVGVVTASFGVADWKIGESPDELMRKVDEAVYRSKEQGRNQITLCA